MNERVTGNIEYGMLLRIITEEVVATIDDMLGSPDNYYSLEDVKTSMMIPLEQLDSKQILKEVSLRLATLSNESTC